MRPLTICSLALLLTASALAAAETITGTVTNKTTNKPAAGDEVVLIRLAQGMQEAERTKSDARGHFSLNVPDAGIHLVRVTHDKANYFRPAPPGTQSVDVDVFNAAAKVEGVTGEADVIRMQTDESGKTLKVVENFFLKNDSNPPRTQFSDRPFEFYLPAGAIIEGSAALGPGSMPVQASPVPLGDPNHYTFIFPLRPGETRFQVTYQLPYNGAATFTPRPTLPTDTIAVMMPKSMTFKGNASAGYTPVTEETTAQTYVVRNAQPSQPLEFSIGGTGQLPRDTATTAGGAGESPAGAAANGSAASDTRPGGGLGNPIDPNGTNDPWAKYKWWILGGLGLAMAAAAGFLLKKTPATPVTGSNTHTGPGPLVARFGHQPAAGDSASLLAVLKDELFQLETEKLQGHLAPAEYAEQKAALETVLRRALRRGEAPQSSANGSPEGEPVTPVATR